MSGLGLMGYEAAIKYFLEKKLLKFILMARVEEIQDLEDMELFYFIKTKEKN